MKLGIKASLAAAFAVLLLVGCPSKPEQPPQIPPQSSDLPDFYLNPPIASGDTIYGVGSGFASSLELARQRANAAALRDIARQVEVTVEAALIEYAQEAGADDNVQVTEFVESTSRQLVEVTLRGVVTVERARDNDGVWYELVSFSTANLIEEAEEVFTRNQDAAFAQFQAQQALEYLDSQLENSPPQSQPEDER